MKAVSYMIYVQAAIAVILPALRKTDQPIERCVKTYMEQKKDHFLDTSDNQRQCYVIPSLDDFDIAEYRKSLKMTQSKFAESHGISLGTLKKWERHSSEPIGEGFKRVLNEWLKTKSFIHD